MRPRLRVPVSILFVLLPALGAPAARAGDAPAGATPEAAAAAVRKALPAPSPAATLRYEGDLLLGRLWAGEVAYAAAPRRFAGAVYWYVTESVFLDVGGAELSYQAAFHLKPDLTLTSGSATCAHRGTKVTVFASAKPDTGYELMRTVRPPKGERIIETLSFAAPDGATTGRTALLLFLRGAKPGSRAAPRAYRLPWLPLWELAVMPTLDGKPPRPPGGVRAPRGRADLAVGAPDPRAPGGPAWPVEVTRSGHTVRLVLDPATRALSRVEAKAPALGVVPRGAGGQRVATDEEGPARTWKQAFLKFGFGYHMARRKLLEQAFDWAAMYAYETRVAKSWSPGRPLAEFREAWIREFLDQSKHRSRAATERLLSMTLATGKVVEQKPDAVVFAAHANFGGGVQRTYHLKRRDGIWYLWRVDF